MKKLILITLVSNIFCNNKVFFKKYNIYNNENFFNNKFNTNFQFNKKIFYNNNKIITKKIKIEKKIFFFRFKYILRIIVVFLLFLWILKLFNFFFTGKFNYYFNFYLKIFFNLLIILFTYNLYIENKIINSYFSILTLNFIVIFCSIDILKNKLHIFFELFFLISLVIILIMLIIDGIIFFNIEKEIYVIINPNLQINHHDLFFIKNTDYLKLLMQLKQIKNLDFNLINDVINNKFIFNLILKNPNYVFLNIYKNIFIIN